MAKKIIKEDTTVNEDEGTSVAASTIHPKSREVSDPKSMTSKTAMLAKMIGSEFSKTDDSLLKFYNQMMARHDEIGHGVGVGDNSASNKASVAMHPSAALGKSVKEAVADDVNKILSEQEGLSEDFKTKATILFEAAIEARVAIRLLELEEENETKLTEEITKTVEEMNEGVEQYLEWAAQEWLTENEVAIESALKNEIASDIMTGLRSLFMENNISIPEEQVDVINTMAEKIDDLEKRLNDEISENADLRKAVDTASKKDSIAKIAEGLTLEQSEKLKELAENIEFEDASEFETKLQTIKESQFVTEGKKSVIAEGLEEIDEENKPEGTKTINPAMKSYVNAISRSAKFNRVS